MSRKKRSHRSRTAKSVALSDHDWRTTDAQEIERRRQRALDEEMRIRNLEPSHPVHSDFEVQSKSGGRYTVEICCVRTREFSCGCVDFRSNGLGTCKHVEGVLLWLRKRSARMLREAGETGSDRPALLLDPATGSLRLQPGATGRVPRALGAHFDTGGGLHSPDPEAAITACRSHKPPVRITQAVERWLEARHRRQDSQAARREYEARVQSGEWPPQETLVPLLPYQREGMLHLAFTERALLADEMGLGKTIQAIAACALLHRLGKARRVLVVTPASLKAEWEEQIRRFTPLPALAVFGHVNARKGIYRDCVRGADAPFFILTNYEQAIPDLEILNEVLQPDIVVLDEAQRIKNWNTKTARRIKQLRSRYAFVLTGTPIENRIDELRSLVDFLDPAVLGPLFRFNREFYELDDKGRPVGVRNLHRLHERVKPLLLRRRKVDVENELPDRTDRNLFVKLSQKQADAYATHEKEVMLLVNASERRPLTQQEKDKLQRELAMMRMICDTNFILDPEDRECPKLTELARILESCVAEGSKVIVFSEWERMLQLVRDHCLDAGIDFAWHTGSVPQQKRRADIVRFKEDPACRVFLTSDAGATGLNLQVASVVVNCDLPWNPARLEQRIARAWRKFQTRAVTVINLVSENTIEHRMLETLATKRTIAESVLDRPGEVTEIRIRKSRTEAADALRRMLGTAGQGAARAHPETQKPAAPRDLAQEFASRIQARLGTQLVACAERRPASLGPTQILVVVEHGPQARGPWLDNLRDEFFPGSAEGVPSHRIEVLDRVTFETVERLVRAGLLSPTEAGRRTLLGIEPTPPPPLTPAQREQMTEAANRARRLFKRARVLGDADFGEEASASVREGLLPAAAALAIARHQSPPESATAADPALWGEAEEPVRAFLGGADAVWRTVVESVERQLQALP